MIRIPLDKNTKVVIKKKYIKDAEEAKTGIFKMLELNKGKLKTDYPIIYDELFKTNNINNAAVEKLLFANRKEMKAYIEKFGDYLNCKIESDWLLNNVFRYDTMSKRKTANSILIEMNVKVCPYCNRQYIITLKNGSVRPQFDHYYPKSRYPYLALSIYNLVPCCSVCNMTKSSLDTLSTPILYPYDEEMGDAVAIEITDDTDDFTKVWQGLSDDFSLKFTIKDKTYKYKEEAQKQVEELYLEDLYNEHKDYVRDIVKSKCINSDERIYDLLNTYPDVFSSYDELRNLLYMIDINKGSWNNRVLAKLAHDINIQISR